MSDHLFLAGKTLAQLRASYTQAPASVRPLWDHVFRLGQANPVWYSSYNVLAWLVRGDEPAKELARRLFLDFTAHRETALLSKEVQFHTHTFSAPLGRLAILYDWIADQGLLTAAEDEAFRAAMLELAFAVPLDQLLGRARAFDNQILSNAFGAALVGTVLGERRGSAALARRLREVGLEWLRDQFGRLPSSCYSGEGSTYHMWVVEPILLLAGVFLEETTGLPVYAQGVAPAMVPLRDWLRMAQNLIGPGGISPGWDAYGIFHCRTKSPLVYLAAREGTGEPLALLRDTLMWPPMAHVAWEFDDRLWSLVWWPAVEMPTTPYQFQPWMQSATAGALQVSETQARLFQYWDETPGVPHCGRPNVNPNAIQFDFAGLPLLLDGYPGIPAERLGLSAAAARDYVGLPLLRTMLKYWRQPETEALLDHAALYALAGCIGESNSLIFDGETWYAPRRAVQGQGLALHAAGALQVVDSDATDYYADRYDVASVTRTSALVAGQVVVTLDRFTARTPHRPTWQAFTWPGAEVDGNRVVATPGGTVRLEVVPLAPVTIGLTTFDGTPHSPCDGSTRLHLTATEATAAGELAVCLAAQALIRCQRDISAGWTVEAGTQAKLPMVDLNTFYLNDTSTTGTPLRFSRTFTVANDGSPLWLRLRFGLHGLKASLNGQALAPLYQQAMMAPVENRLLSFPWVFDLGPHLRPGENHLLLVTENYHGESLVGPVELCQPVLPLPVQATAEGDRLYAFSIGGQTWRLGLARTGLLPWGGGVSDAAHVLAGPAGELVFAGVMNLTLGERRLTFAANRPVDLALLPDGTVDLGGFAAGARATLAVGDTLLLIRQAELLQVAYRSESALSLRLRTGTTVVVGTARHAPRYGVVSLDLPPSPGTTTTAPASVEAVYRLLDTLPAGLEEALRAALQSDDWGVQTAAADVAGLLGLAGVGADLLALFRREAVRPPARELTHSWAFSKMNMALQEDADRTPDREADPVHDAKRWRLSRALIVALGRTGQRAAIPDLVDAMTTGRLFFPALAQVPLALARLDAREALPVLESLWHYAEVNTERHIRLAACYLRGERSRAELEAAANPG